MTVKDDQHTAQTFIVSNPQAGARITGDLLAIVKQRLDQHGIQVTAEFTTRAPRDGIRVGQELSQLVKSTRSPATLVLLGGDGTTYEVLNGLYQVAEEGPIPQVRLAIVPTGTANALYAGLYPPETSQRHVSQSKPSSAGSSHDWRLRSLDSFLAHCNAQHRPASLYHLTLAQSTLSLTDGSTKHAFSHLVTSHALHAAILADSEELRAEYPGVERYKMAANKNINRWVDGILSLQRRHGQQSVERFDPAQQAFVPVTSDASSYDLQGPIFYLACASTDRLEPQFVPAPFAFPAGASSSSSSSSSSSGTASGADPTPSQDLAHLLQLSRPADALDIVVIRPLRDPLVQQILSEDQAAIDTDQSWQGQNTHRARAAFAEQRAIPITQAMYAEGKHVYLRYPGKDEPPSKALSPDNSGEPVVEYYRCAGYTWTPSKTTPRAGLTCLDGDLYEASQATVATLKKLSDGITVYA